MTRYAIGLGSNLGDRLENLRAGDAGLSQLGKITARSALYETEPIGGPRQDPFLNAVVLLESELEPHRLLDACLEIEAQRGRERSVDWGPRTLDIDIITYDGPPLSDDRLTIPHPLAADREFVLRPLAETWPDAPVGDDTTAREQLEEVGPQGVDLLVRQWDRDRPVGSWLAGAQLALILLTVIGVLIDGSAENLDEHPVISALGLTLAILGAALGGSASVSAGRDLTVKPEPKEGAISTPGSTAGTLSMYDSLLLGAGRRPGRQNCAWRSAGWPSRSWSWSRRTTRSVCRIRYPAYASYRRRVRRLIPGLRPRRRRDRRI